MHMNGKLEEILNKAKLDELLHKKKVEDQRKGRIIWVLAIIGAVASVAGIAYAVYRYINPNYLDDYDDDFDYDDFEDEFESDGECDCCKASEEESTESDAE